MKPFQSPGSLIAAILAVIAIFAFGYHHGRKSALPELSEQSFRVTGDSMAPTLKNGDVCQIIPPSSELGIGDVVAISWDGKSRIKRLAALGGDTVDLLSGRLHVNGTRLDDLVARRANQIKLQPALVPVPSHQSDWHRDAAYDQWIVYAHRNPHQAGRNTAVMDDYPSNLNVRRVLNEVDRLVVKLSAIGRSDSVPQSDNIDVAFFSKGGTATMINPQNGIACQRNARLNLARVSTSHLPVDRHHDALHQGVPVLDASHPIAIRIGNQEASQFVFEVFREIEYRDDRPGGVIRYPLTLSDGQVFVVGDNVPVSVDSRTVGPLSEEQIIGRAVIDSVR